MELVSPVLKADVAINGERITAVGDISDAAYRAIDATGKLVTPGFVDTHTHMDAAVHVGSTWHPGMLARHYHADSRKLWREFCACQADRPHGVGEGA